MFLGSFSSIMMVTSSGCPAGYRDEGVRELLYDPPLLFSGHTFPGFEYDKRASGAPAGIVVPDPV